LKVREFRKYFIFVGLALNSVVPVVVFRMKRRHLREMLLELPLVIHFPAH
jgi:hypothetical protein